MADLTDIVKAKASITDAAKQVSYNDTYLGYWPNLTGAAGIGATVGNNSDKWEAINAIPNVTLSEPTNANDDWFKRQDSVFDYVVSQYADGVSSDVGYIYAGQDVTNYLYMIWPTDGRVYEVDGATGDITAAFDPLDGSDAGLSKALVNKNLNPATAADITAGTSDGIVTAAELRSANVVSDLVKAPIYNITLLTPTLNATQTNST